MSTKQPISDTSGFAATPEEVESACEFLKTVTYTEDSYLFLNKENMQKDIRSGKYFHRCHICRTVEFGTWCEPMRTEVIIQKICRTCHFWMGIIEEYKSGHTFVCGGHARSDGGDKPGNSNTRWLGHAGHRWYFRMADGKEFTTNNLWYRGEVPERWRDQLSDNATQLKKSEYQSPE